MQHKFTNISSNPSDQNDTKSQIENTEKEKTPLQQLVNLTVYASDEEFKEKKSEYLRRFMNSPSITQISDKKESNPPNSNTQIIIRQLVQLTFHGSVEEFEEKKSEYIRELLNSPSNSSVVKEDQNNSTRINLSRAHVMEDLKQDQLTHTEESSEQAEGPKWLWETRNIETPTDTKTSELGLKQAREFSKDKETPSLRLKQAREFSKKEPSQTNTEQARETSENNWFFNLFTNVNKESKTTTAANKNTTLKR